MQEILSIEWNQQFVRISTNAKEGRGWKFRSTTQILI